MRQAYLQIIVISSMYRQRDSRSLGQIDLHRTGWRTPAYMVVIRHNCWSVDADRYPVQSAFLTTLSQETVNRYIINEVREVSQIVALLQFDEQGDMKDRTQPDLGRSWDKRHSGRVLSRSCAIGIIGSAGLWLHSGQLCNPNKSKPQRR